MKVPRRKRSIEIGDLVKVALGDRVHDVGVVVNTWTNHKKVQQGVDVMFGTGEIKNIGVRACRVINEAR